MIRGINQTLQQYILKNKGYHHRLSNFKCTKQENVQILAAVGSLAIQQEIKNQGEKDIGDFISEWNNQPKSYEQIRQLISNPNQTNFLIDAFNASGNGNYFRKTFQSNPSHQLPINVINRDIYPQNHSHQARKSYTRQEFRQPYYHAEHSHSPHYQNDYYRGRRRSYNNNSHNSHFGYHREY